MKSLSILMPFFIALSGIILDHWTTTIGLSMGFAEINPEYHPLKALAIFWGSITILTFTLPKTRKWMISINTLASLPYIGVVNNILVILGIFQGLAI